jgi:hypothetical protein
MFPVSYRDLELMLMDRGEIGMTCWSAYTSGPKS